MKVRMKVSISGTRSGADWPPRGEILECDNDEGAQLCAGGLAEPVYEPEPVETATAPEPEPRAEEPEKRGPGRPRKNT